jgi:hypothetical protein
MSFNEKVEYILLDFLIHNQRDRDEKQVCREGKISNIYKTES